MIEIISASLSRKQGSMYVALNFAQLTMDRSSRSTQSSEADLSFSTKTGEVTHSNRI